MLTMKQQTKTEYVIPKDELLEKLGIPNTKIRYILYSYAADQLTVEVDDEPS